MRGSVLTCSDHCHLKLFRLFQRNVSSLLKYWNAHFSMIIADFFKTTHIKLKIRFRGKTFDPKFSIHIALYFNVIMLHYCNVFVLRNRVLRNLTHSFEFQSHSLATPSGGWYINRFLKDIAINIEQCDINKMFWFNIWYFHFWRLTKFVFEYPMRTGNYFRCVSKLFYVWKFWTGKTLRFWASA